PLIGIISLLQFGLDQERPAAGGTFSFLFFGWAARGHHGRDHHARYEASHARRFPRRQADAQAGLIPARLYGHKEPNAFFSLVQEEIEKAIHKGAHVIDLKTDGKTQKALIREVQWDHIGLEVVHIDFARVSETDRVAVTVPIEIRGTAPGIAAGGVL